MSDVTERRAKIVWALDALRANGNAGLACAVADELVALRARVSELEEEKRAALAKREAVSVPEVFASIGARIATQDNAITQDPLFVVFEKQRCRIDKHDPASERFVTACFTRKGAEDYIAANGHNLRDPFIYVASLFRNREMIGLPPRHARRLPARTAGDAEHHYRQPPPVRCCRHAARTAGG